MHELALTRSVLCIALEEAARHNAARVCRIELLIGEYHSALPACMQEYFRILSRGTAAENAQLICQKIPAKIACTACGYTGCVQPHGAVCPRCHSDEIQIVDGMQFCVNTLEVE